MDGQNIQRQDANSQMSMTDSSQNQKILDELPPPNTKRWVIRRKAAVVAAVKNGVITLDDVCWLYWARCSDRRYHRLLVISPDPSK